MAPNLGDNAWKKLKAARRKPPLSLWFCTIYVILLPLETIASPWKEIYGRQKYTSSFTKKKPVDFDDELKIGDVWYDNMTKITI